jgi:hypothetical protein
MTCNYQTCTGCRKLKLLAEGFYYEKRINKHMSRCKECVKAYLQHRRDTVPGALERERECQKLSMRARKLKDPTLGKWASKTPEQKRKAYEAVCRWRSRNSYQTNLEAKQGVRMRRSKAFLKAWPLIKAHYGNKCLWCGAQGKEICFDHVLPLALKGPNSLANGQPLCIACNSTKGAMDRCRDCRPDKGAWIVELVRLNPWLAVISREHGWHLTPEGRRLKEELDEIVEKDLILPSEGGGIGQSDGNVDMEGGREVGEEVGSVRASDEERLTRVQKNNKRILDDLLANLPRE